jgi:hypothetical protein
VALQRVVCDVRFLYTFCVRFGPAAPKSVHTWKQSFRRIITRKPFAGWSLRDTHHAAHHGRAYSPSTPSVASDPANRPRDDERRGPVLCGVDRKFRPYAAVVGPPVSWAAGDAQAPRLQILHIARKQRQHSAKVTRLSPTTRALRERRQGARTCDAASRALSGFRSLEAICRPRRGHLGSSRKPQLRHGL